jgi:hypothetical protein
LTYFFELFEESDMNCSKCDAELTESSKFCPSCGTQQTNPIDEGSQVTSATEDKPESGFLAGYIVFGVMIAGLWYWIGSMESANGLIVSLIFGLWFAFAAFGFHKKWSALVSFGGGFVGFLGLAALSFTLFSGNEGGSKGTGGSARSNASTISHDDSGLQKHAMRLVHDRNIGVAGLCDKIYDVKFNQVKQGTLKANNAGNTRFPGMVANVEYMCVNPITGDRQKNTDFWVIFGYDEITGHLRCAQVAGRPLIENLMSDCDFK